MSFKVRKWPKGRSGNKQLAIVRTQQTTRKIAKKALSLAKKGTTPQNEHHNAPITSFGGGGVPAIHSLWPASPANQNGTITRIHGHIHVLYAAAGVDPVEQYPFRIDLVLDKMPNGAQPDIDEVYYSLTPNPWALRNWDYKERFKILRSFQPSRKDLFTGEADQASYSISFDIPMKMVFETSDKVDPLTVAVMTKNLVSVILWQAGNPTTPASYAYEIDVESVST